MYCWTGSASWRFATSGWRARCHKSPWTNRATRTWRNTWRRDGTEHPRYSWPPTSTSSIPCDVWCFSFQCRKHTHRASKIQEMRRSVCLFVCLISLRIADLSKVLPLRNFLSTCQVHEGSGHVELGVYSRRVVVRQTPVSWFINAKSVGTHHVVHRSSFQRRWEQFGIVTSNTTHNESQMSKVSDGSARERLQNSPSCFLCRHREY